jgi:hypothetical protein
MKLSASFNLICSAAVTVAIASFLIGSSEGCAKHPVNKKDTIPADTTAVYENKPVSEDQYALVHGSSIQIDPTFAYYLGRSAESIAEEIELAGYKTVHYVAGNLANINRELIDAFHRHGIKVWLMAFGNGTPTTAGLPSGWEEWKMELNGGSNGFIYLSPFNKDYVEWKKTTLAQVMKSYPFDGIELAEPYFPEWDAIQKGNYGDVGPNAQKAFKEEYGLTMPDFSNPDAKNYYTKVPVVYNKWIQFRVDGVNNYLNEVFNGSGGIREVRPDALVATWSLGIDAGPASVALLREYQGLDAPSMIRLVKPDAHFIQTHWPDWIKSEAQLPPDYMRAYQPFYNQIRKMAPDLPIGLQADIGSSQDMIKSGEWFNKFEVAADQLGYSTTTAYEYHIGGYIYNDKPAVKRVRRNGKDSVILSFNKRIDANSAANPDNYSFYSDNNKLNINVQNIVTDGNMVILISGDFPADPFKIAVSHIKDTPDVWLFKGYAANEIAAGTIVSVDGYAN